MNLERCGETLEVSSTSVTFPMSPPEGLIKCLDVEGGRSEFDGGVVQLLWSTDIDGEVLLLEEKTTSVIMCLDEIVRANATQQVVSTRARTHTHTHAHTHK